MTGNEFLKKLKKLGKQEGIVVEHKKERGKGSHSTVCYGDKFTIIKDLKKEFGTGYLNALCKQLGITLSDLNSK